MREATEPACAVRPIAQMVCRVVMCLVCLVLVFGIRVADSGKACVNRAPE